MRLGVSREKADRERRVALVPEVVRRLTGSGHDVRVERGAGAGAFVPDAHFEEAGAALVEGPDAVYECDVVVKVAPPSAEETAKLRSNSVLIGFRQPLGNGDGVRAIADSGATSIALEAVPRISRAQ